MDGNHARFPNVVILLMIGMEMLLKQEYNKNEKMKNLKKMKWLMACLAIIATFTSCLDDKNDDSKPRTLTQAQIASQLFEMAGDYSGYLYFTNDTTMKRDSIPCAWHVSAPDSAIVIHNFPMSVLANGIRDTLAKNTLLNGESLSLRALLRPYFNDNHEKGYYTYWMLPMNDKLEFSVYRNNTKHDVKVDFTYQMQVNSLYNYASIYYSVGEYLNREMVSYILIKDVVFDNQTFTTGWATFIYGKK